MVGYREWLRMDSLNTPGCFRVTWHRYPHRMGRCSSKNWRQFPVTQLATCEIQREGSVQKLRTSKTYYWGLKQETPYKVQIKHLLIALWDWAKFKKKKSRALENEMFYTDMVSCTALVNTLPGSERHFHVVKAVLGEHSSILPAILQARTLLCSPHLTSARLVCRFLPSRSPLPIPKIGDLRRLPSYWAV